MFFQRDFTVINGDNINGLQLMQEVKVFDLILTKVPSTVEGDWKRSIEKRVKLAHKCLSSIGAVAIFVAKERQDKMKEILDEQIGENNHVVTYEWKDESLMVYGKANIYDEGRIDQFLDEIRNMPRFDKKKEKKSNGIKIRNVSFLKAIIKTFMEEDGELLDMYAHTGMTGVAVWELNHDDNGVRGFTLINHDEDTTCSSILYPHIHKQSIIYESPFDYVILDKESDR